MEVLFSSLILLAPIDSTSFGTLLIPVWLLMSSERVSIGRFLIYILTVAGSYFFIGVGIMLGADALVTSYASLFESETFLMVQLVTGIILLIISQLMDTKKARIRAQERVKSGESKLLNWRKQLMDDSNQVQNSLVLLMVLAVTAVALEVATMLPYLAAIGLIILEELSWPTSSILLLGYCVVMILPACILMIGRLIAHRALAEPLKKMDN